jgi:hypothetical protein
VKFRQFTNVADTVAMQLTCIDEITSLNLGQITKYPDVYCGFPQALHAIPNNYLKQATIASSPILTNLSNIIILSSYSVVIFSAVNSAHLNTYKMYS